MPTHSSFTPFLPGAEDDPARRISSIDPKLSRSNYFDGKLLRASDLIRDQLYLDERLREAGRAVGEGIVRGFDVTLSLEGDLTVTPGLAIAPSGRILEHEGPGALVVNLFDTAQFSALNPDGVPRLERGLYAVAARLVQRSDGAAEVFPRDLAGERRFHANAFTEGVELVLTPLNTRLPSVARRTLGAGAYGLRGVSDRAALARDLLRNQGQPPELDEDAVALALLAVERGGPAWLDLGLVRRPQRAPGMPGAAQADLMAHHDELLAAVVAERQAAGRTGAFAARDYFERLPPAGRMPPACIDPASGVQRFFPAEFDVQIAPVRSDDLPAILAEAALLDPIELSGTAPADVMILVPLSDGVFDGLARRLELDPTERAARESAYRTALDTLDTSDGTAGEIRTRLVEYQRLAIARAPLVPNRLPSLGTLTLRARGAPPALDTDVAAWSAIHAEAQRTGRLWFVRRAPRAAATEVSAVVAARGHALPPLGDAQPTEVGELRDALAEAERERDAAEAEVAELRAALEALRERLSEGGEASEADLSEARERAARLEARLAEAEARAGRLAEAAEEARTFERERDAARAEAARLRRELEDDSGEEELRGEIGRLEAVLAEERTRSARLERTVETGRTLERERDEARADAERLRAELADDSAEVALRGEVTRLETALSRERARTGELETTAGRLVEVERERDAVRADAERLRAELADDSAEVALRSEVGRLEEALSAERTRVTELESTAGRVSAVERERDEARAALERLRREEAADEVALRSEVGRLEEALAAERSRVAELETANRRVATLERERDAALADLARARTGTVRDGTPELSGEVVRLERDLALANRRLLIAGATERPSLDISEPRTVLQLARDRDADERSVAALRESVGRSRPQLVAVNVVVAAAGPEYDAVLWPTLALVAERGELEAFADFLRRAVEAGHAPGLAVAARGGEFGVTPALRDGWARVDLE